MFFESKCTRFYGTFKLPSSNKYTASVKRDNE